MPPVALNPPNAPLVVVRGADTFTAGGFIGVNSCVGYYLWLWALNHSAATNVAVFQALNPITATLLGTLLLAEPISLLFLCGLVCVALGVWLAHRRPQTGEVRPET